MSELGTDARSVRESRHRAGFSVAKLAPAFAVAFIAMTASRSSMAQEEPASETEPAPTVDRATPVRVMIASTGRPQFVWFTSLDSMTIDGPTSCHTPCELFLPPGRYLIASKGKGVRRFEGPIEVPAAGTRVRLRAASKGGFVAGVVLTSFGAVGTLMFGAYAMFTVASNPGDSENRFGAGLLGAAILLVPAPCLVVGIKLLLASGHRGFETLPLPIPAIAKGFLNVAPVLGPSTAGLRWTMSF